MKAVHRSRLVIIAVAALFLLPVLVATYLNSSWSSWAPTATKNFGTLVQPPVLVDAFASDDPEANWTLAYDGRGGCGAGCQEDLKLLSQIERAESSASISSLYKIASALDVHIADLFGDF